MSVSKNDSVIVFGGGGHAKVVVATLEQAGRQVQAIYDDDPGKIGGALAGIPVVGSTSAAAPGAAGVIAIGDNLARERLASQQRDRPWLTAIHPRAEVDPSARIGPGAVIFAGAIIQADAVLGAHVIVNTGATIDHDCT